jgi:hypothetical protein
MAQYVHRSVIALHLEITVIGGKPPVCDLYHVYLPLADKEPTGSLLPTLSATKFHVMPNRRFFSVF